MRRLCQRTAQALTLSYTTSRRNTCAACFASTPQAVLSELMGSLQRLLDRYDTAVLLANLPAGGHTPGSCAGGGADAGPVGGQAAASGREPRWPVLYVNNAWTALTGGRA